MKNVLLKTLEEIIIMANKNQKQWTLSITNNQIISLCRLVIKRLSKEPSIIPLSGDFIVVGDIHGDIKSLLRIFTKHNYPPKSSYIFLGDYIDRGSYSCEVLLFLYSLKVLYPMNIFLLRGNHECESMALTQKFRNECLTKYSKNAFLAFSDTFNYLSLAIQLNSVIFCVHGGISPSFTTIDDVNKLPNLQKPIRERFIELVDDMLWSDPSQSTMNFSPSPRTLGKLYGPEAVDDFLQNKCDHFFLIIRAHQFMELGFGYPFDKKTVLTIFSSIDYCGAKNPGSVAIVTTNNISIDVLEYKEDNQKYDYPEFLFGKSQIEMRNPNVITDANEIGIDHLNPTLV